MKLYTKKEILPIILVLVIFAIGLYFWPFLPERVPSHWNLNGEVDAWASKNFTVIFFPALIAVLYILLSIFPLMDPLKANIELFSHLYFWFKVVFVLFLGALYFMTIYAGLGYAINVGRYVMLGIAMLFLFIGLMTPQIKKNYTIGIRLPWTLHSEIVWDKTHQLGGKLFVGLAVLIALLSFFPSVYAFWALISGIILLFVVLIWYAYREWRIIERGSAM